MASRSCGTSEIANVGKPIPYPSSALRAPPALRFTRRKNLGRMRVRLLRQLCDESGDLRAPLSTLQHALEKAQRILGDVGIPYVTPAQCRAAPAWLNWTQVYLARRASSTGQDITLANVQRWEGGGRLKVEKHLANATHSMMQVFDLSPPLVSRV